MTPTTFERVPAIRHKLARSESEIDLARESRGYWDSALLALRRDRLTLAAFAMLLVTALFCFVLARPVTEALGIDPNDTDPLIAFEGPSVAHPMGVDQVGRDQLARLLYGGRVSIGIGFFAAVIIMTIGLALGSIAGFYGKIVDDVVMWFINTLNSIPFILLLLIISLLFKPTALTLTIFIGLVSWTEISRIVRGQVLQVKEMEYVTAARALGVMQAAYEAARQYALDRKVFGQPIAEYQLTQAKLGRMAVLIQASRQFSYVVARLMAKGEGTAEASMIKAYVCKAAEWVTREAMQIHGGMGYAEEYDVSRYFVDARVLSIFEGADETLCLKVIARRLVAEASA